MHSYIAELDAAYRHEQLRLTFLTDRKNRLESRKYLKVLRQELKAEHARLKVIDGVDATLTDEELLNALGVL
jgi:uncharacterized protein YnzC (UPF0291/DUF896 family)